MAAGGGGGGSGCSGTAVGAAPATAAALEGPGTYVIGGFAIELRVPLLCWPTSVSASDSVVSHRGGASASDMGAATLVSTIGSDDGMLSTGGCRCGCCSWACCSRCSRCCRAESRADCQGLLEWWLECEADLCFPSRGAPRPIGDCLPVSRDDDGSVDVEGRP